MQIKKLTRYRLLKKDIPEILHKKVIMKDCNVGGAKLQYEISSVKALVFMLFGKQRIIVISTDKNFKRTSSFLNPYKKIWDASRNKLPRNLWGKSSHPLTNLWIELEMDYKDISSGEIILKQEIRNTNLTRNFSKAKELFFIN